MSLEEMEGFGKIFVILGIGISMISGLAYMFHVASNQQFIQGIEFLGGIIFTLVGAWMWIAAHDSDAYGKKMRQPSLV